MAKNVSRAKNDMIKGTIQQGYKNPVCIKQQNVSIHEPNLRELKTNYSYQIKHPSQKVMEPVNGKSARI